LQKLPNQSDSNRLPGVFNAGESITNKNNYTNIQSSARRESSKSCQLLPDDSAGVDTPAGLAGIGHTILKYK
jgi:hypothetical protein